MFSCEICETFKNTFFYRTHPLAASKQDQQKLLKNNLAILVPKREAKNGSNSDREIAPPKDCPQTSFPWVRVRVWVRIEGNILGGVILLVHFLVQVQTK